MSHTPNSRGSRTLRAALIAALLGGTALGGIVGVGRVFAAVPVNQPPSQAVSGMSTVPDFSDLVAKVRPAVVSITTHLRPQAEANEEGIPTPFGMLRPQHPQPIEAKGSGFIVDPSGIVVTNNHVVENASSVFVTLDDGTQLPAHILGRDPRTDLAVLKIDAGHELPYLALGDSSKVRVGQWVVAMGNPFGLGGTVTAGIVSAKGRDIGAGPYDQFLQIDAPINQGNSGGPLFTQDGRVVGVNSEILSPTGGSVGIGFAIPANLVKTVIAQLEHGGHVTRGYLGVETQGVDQAMASALHLKPQDAVKGKADEFGALVASVEPDSPAAKAKLQPGDVIDEVNGQSVATPRDLAIDIADIKPGDTAKLELIRNGARQSVSVTVASLPNDQGNVGGGNTAGHATVGLELQPLTQDLRNQLDVPADMHGVVVANVAAGSPAQSAGIQQGDVIIGVADQEVGTVQQATRALRAAEQSNASVALRIWRDGHTAFVAVDLGKSAPGGKTPDHG
jgi:serine protease Do